MAKLICILGKSASGKDSVYRCLLGREDLALEPLIPYTTRPMREGEREGEEYHFVSRDFLLAMRSQGKVIEERSYQTIEGEWNYFTAEDNSMHLDQKDYLLITTPDAFVALRNYFGVERVLDIYIELEDGERLARALARERSQSYPRYEELCRRFLADQRDFSEKVLTAAGICHRFENQSLLQVSEDIAHFLLNQMREDQ